MILRIKNMESSRCKTMVTHEMNKLGLQDITVELGEVGFAGDISNENLDLFGSALKGMGLELMVDKRRVLLAQIKDAVYQLVYFSDDLPKQNYSDYISEKLNVKYSVLVHVFSSMENNTIENYIILQRIERVKELLIYTDMSLGEIAFKMRFSSDAHLSNQFKKFAGLTPSFFRKNRNIQN